VKKVILLIVILFGLYFTGWISKRAEILNRSEIFQDVILEKIIEAKKNGGTVDLRAFNSDWDELIVWGPYTNICKLGIKGSFFNPLLCFELPNKSECYLLFLKSKKIMAKIEVSRRILDFASVSASTRIPRASANFQFVGDNDFPKVKIIEEVSP
jgi:hypothetical protein